MTSCNYFFDTLFLQLLPILSITVEVRHATLTSRARGWSPARHTELAWSQLGSGTPHWTRRIAVEVRLATLNSRDHSWGPARHTELAGSRLGSGTPHWTRRIAVGVRHATLNSRARGWSPARHTELTGSQLRSDEEEDDRRRRKEEEGEGEETNIKSNNPHLTGGESPETNPRIWQGSFLLHVFQCLLGHLTELEGGGMGSRKPKFNVLGNFSSKPKSTLQWVITGNLKSPGNWDRYVTVQQNKAFSVSDLFKENLEHIHVYLAKSCKITLDKSISIDKMRQT